MDVTFADRKIKKCANDDRLALREFGKTRFDLFKKRMTALYVAENLEELRHQPGNWHELKENRKGQWACDLDQPYDWYLSHKNTRYPLTNQANTSGLKLRRSK
ncbi:MAG: hypothetical protein AB2L20_05785 [Mangrovibacterium sp.]